MFARFGSVRFVCNFSVFSNYCHCQYMQCTVKLKFKIAKPRKTETGFFRLGEKAFAFKIKKSKELINRDHSIITFA